ncbi:MAG TPA: NAD(P)H-dependent glycerol-3-phosphate dehydrogenase, partial [Oceanospirillales bacterium]|nr:NAD(P)H-dependent glycerol-3-phosphate dehydrogenase [Oceanospirillales bacterium]
MVVSNHYCYNPLILISYMRNKCNKLSNKLKRLPNSKPMRFAVIGAGSWGTALAMQMARNGTTYLWGRNTKHLQDMQKTRSNEAYLPGAKFPDNLILESDLKTAIEASDAILLVSPSHAFAELLTRIKPYIGDRPLAWASKGFEPGSGRFLHEVAQDIIGKDKPIALVTGPSFAKDVADGKPTLVTVATTDETFAHQVANALHNEKFRVYISDDIIGA